MYACLWRDKKSEHIQCIMCLCTRADVILNRPYKKKKKKKKQTHTSETLLFAWIQRKPIRFNAIRSASKWTKSWIWIYHFASLKWIKPPYFWVFFYFTVIRHGRICRGKEKENRINCVTYACMWTLTSLKHRLLCILVRLIYDVIILLAKHIKTYFDILLLHVI